MKFRCEVIGCTAQIYMQGQGSSVIDSVDSGGWNCVAVHGGWAFIYSDGAVNRGHGHSYGWHEGLSLDY